MSSKNKFLAKYGSAKHLDRALNDKDECVRRSAIDNPNYKKYFS